MQDDNPILKSNIAKLIGTAPELPRFEQDRRDTALKALQAQQALISAHDTRRPSRLTSLARTCMITMAAIVVLILVWSIPSAKHAKTHAAEVASLNAQLAEQEAEIDWLRAHREALAPRNKDLVFEELVIKAPHLIESESLYFHKQMAPLVRVLRDLEKELEETSFHSDHPEVTRQRDVIKTLRGTIGKYLSEEDINSFLRYIDQYHAK